jgi:hypothetical protein
VFRSSVRVLALYLPGCGGHLIKGEITMNTNKAFWAVISVVSVCSILVFGKVYTDRKASASASEMALRLLEEPEATPAAVEPEVAIEVAPQESAYDAVKREFTAAYIDSFKASFFEKAHRLPSEELAAELALASFEEVTTFHYGKDAAKAFSSTSPQWAKMAVMPLSLKLALSVITAEVTVKYAKEGKAFAK